MRSAYVAMLKMTSVDWSQQSNALFAKSNDGARVFIGKHIEKYTAKAIR